MAKKIKIRHVEPMPIDPNNAYIDKDGKLRFLPAPSIILTREEIKTMMEEEDSDGRTI